MALRERAFTLLAGGARPEEQVLAHVYGARLPSVGTVREQLAAPLLADERLVRQPDGWWRLADQPRAAAEDPVADVVTLALTCTGSRPGRDRILAIGALHVGSGRRLSVRLVADRTVQRPLRERARTGAAAAPHAEEVERTFADIVGDLLAFLGSRPILLQEALLAGKMLAFELRRLRRPALHNRLLDVATLADRLLDVPPAKPTLALIAEACGVPYVHVGDPDEEARVLARVLRHLADAAVRAGTTPADALRLAEASPPDGPRPLHNGHLGALPDLPGVYVLRGAGDEALYVGKARRLRERLGAYAGRPLGATRRLEGLAGETRTVDPRICGTDLEALVLESREIARLRPRFNTQRQVHPGRAWLRLPPPPTEPAPGRKRPRRAPPRIELCGGPADAAGPGAAYLGPFPGQQAAAAARDLARALFGLDEARRTWPLPTYLLRLRAAWRFLQGEPEEGVAAARAALAVSVASRDPDAERRCRARLRAALAYDPRAATLPADPREARFALLRPMAGELGVEGFVLDAAVLVAHARCPEPWGLHRFALELSETHAPRTEPRDRWVVLRWLNAQRRPPAYLVRLAADPGEASVALFEAGSALFAWLQDRARAAAEAAAEQHWAVAHD